MNREMRARHRAWKRKAVLPLHAFANQEGWCSEFERMALKPAGLPARENLRYAYPNYRIAGEDTVEEFEAWRTRAGRHLHDLARRYGRTDDYGKVIYGAEFTAGAPELVTVRVTVTYDRVLEVEEGEEPNLELLNGRNVAMDLRSVNADAITVRTEIVETRKVEAP